MLCEWIKQAVSLEEEKRWRERGEANAKILASYLPRFMRSKQYKDVEKTSADEFQRMKYQNRVADKIMDKVLWLDRLNQKSRASNMYKVVEKLKNKSLETVRRLAP